MLTFVAHYAGLDILTVGPVAANHWANGKGGKGLNWFFNGAFRSLTSALLDDRGEPTNTFSACLYPLVVTEERPPLAGRRYACSWYATEYPFYPLTLAHVERSFGWLSKYRGSQLRT